MANIEPNRFQLQNSDGKTKVDYETAGIHGHPSTLNLSQGGPIRHFAGSQIRRVNTEIGTLVSVTTQMTVDTGSTSFSVLIPAITLKTRSDRQAFATEGIVTHHTGPISVPPTGVHETYQYIPMKGEASYVVAAAESEREEAPKVGRGTA
jgi:hypothetical protein